MMMIRFLATTARLALLFKAQLACSRAKIKSVLRALSCALLVGVAFTSQTGGNGRKRVYVEPFVTKVGAEKLHDDLTAELRKVPSLSLVSDVASADVTLGGGGEIWVRGYRSFSPRSHMKLPTNGTPIYGGYLSVELRNKTGVTLWSYLVTPGTSSEDVSRDLAKRIAKHLDEGLAQSEPVSPTKSLSQPATALTGAGATFPYPVYLKWFTNYRIENESVRISYDAIGSEGGIRKLLEGAVDFGSSDSPEAIHELAPNRESDYLFIPSVVGAVVPIVNLPGFPKDIAFTPEALAGIFLGKIKKWNDPILQRANRGLRLPDLDIVVVHRADGSGTSYAWTDYLSATNPQWQAEVGSGLAPRWPTGRGANGNEGVAGLVKEIGGSIGYVEFIYALQNHIGYGKVRNRDGEFIQASLESIASAVGHTMDIRDDFNVSIVDAPGAGAYPIASFTWFVVPIHIADEAKRNAITAFFRWMLGPGQRQAAALGYLALPKDVALKAENAIAKIR